MVQRTDTVRADFDRLALLEERHGWSHNDHYHSFILSELPPGCRDVLEVGCGTGALARQMAGRAERVVGLDLSPEMVRLAAEKSRGYRNVEFSLADVLEWEWPAEAFDCIVSVATLHHMPLDLILEKMKSALRPGGKLIVVDLYKAATPGDFLGSALAVPVALALKLRHTGMVRVPPDVRQAWDEHGRTDRYLTIPEVRHVCAGVLPGAHVKRHMLWRYSIVWQKRPLGQGGQPG
jgi:SAM-dependent methyltransferase